MTEPQVWALIGVFAASMATMITLVLTTMNARFARVDARFDSMDAKFDAVNRRLDYIDRDVQLVMKREFGES